VANDDFQSAMDAWAERVRTGIQDAVGQVCEEIRAGAEVYAPARTGALKASIVVFGPMLAARLPGLEKSAPRGPAVYAARVGPDASIAVYARIRDIGGSVPGLRPPTWPYAKYAPPWPMMKVTSAKNPQVPHPFLKWGFAGHPIFLRAGVGNEQPQHGTSWFSLAADEVTRPNESSRANAIAYRHMVDASPVAGGY